jgi:hypothetical protein
MMCIFRPSGRGGDDFGAPVLLALRAFHQPGPLEVVHEADRLGSRLRKSNKWFE